MLVLPTNKCEQVLQDVNRVAEHAILTIAKYGG
jgi:hypothetical protein